MSSPTDVNGEGLPASKFIEPFRRLNIKAVVRLNEKLYDESELTLDGIEVYNLEFLDGSCPSEVIKTHTHLIGVQDLLQCFNNVCDKVHYMGGAVAVHCRAGLGRTGTLIACYIMSKYAFEPEALIGWMRIARPGSVIGIQQNFLSENYQKIRLANRMVSPIKTVRPQSSNSYQRNVVLNGAKNILKNANSLIPPTLFQLSHF